MLDEEKRFARAMTEVNQHVDFVIGPDGQKLTKADLPSPTTRRWVIRRKAEVVAAVRGGLISLEEACESYGISLEEFETWAKSIDRFGIQGLRTTRIQKYRAKF